MGEHDLRRAVETLGVLALVAGLGPVGCSDDAGAEGPRGNGWIAPPTGAPTMPSTMDDSVLSGQPPAGDTASGPGMAGVPGSSGDLGHAGALAPAPIEEQPPPSDDHLTQYPPTPGSGCITDTSPTDKRTLRCDNYAYNLSVPDSCGPPDDPGAEPCGIIMDTHGATMDANDEERQTKLAELGRAAIGAPFNAPLNYIVIQPSGSKNASGNGSWLAKFRSILEEAAGDFKVDMRRIHVGGFSQGGYATARMVCLDHDLVASWAIMAGHKPESSDAGCDPLPQTPILITHGPGDPFSPYRDATELESTFQQLTGMLTPEILATDSDYAYKRYAGNGYLLQFLDHTYRTGYRGHCIVGYGSTYGCPSDFKSGEEILRFYIDNPKP